RHASHPILLQSARERAQWGYEIPGCIDPGPGCHVRTQRRSRLLCDGATVGFDPHGRDSRCHHADRPSRLGGRPPDPVEGGFGEVAAKRRGPCEGASRTTRTAGRRGGCEPRRRRRGAAGIIREPRRGGLGRDRDAAEKSGASEAGDASEGSDPPEAREADGAEASETEAASEADASDADASATGAETGAGGPDAGDKASGLEEPGDAAEDQTSGGER